MLGPETKRFSCEKTLARLVPNSTDKALTAHRTRRLAAPQYSWYSCTNRKCPQGSIKQHIIPLYCWHNRGYERESEWFRVLGVGGGFLLVLLAVKSFLKRKQQNHLDLRSLQEEQIQRLAQNIQTPFNYFTFITLIQVQILKNVIRPPLLRYPQIKSSTTNRLKRHRIGN
ncbi:hypothetical protein GOODEAATRI_008728 [Goodea atripinnis]|uniref:Uncharacterized protein n=1 Tax=Goodea atripinnis TaxID=208336 RepID=A0ABV0MH74_9TELE